MRKEFFGLSSKESESESERWGRGSEKRERVGVFFSLFSLRRRFFFFAVVGMLAADISL